MEHKSIRNTCLLIISFVALLACQQKATNPKMVVINIRGASFVGIQHYANNHPQGYLSRLLDKKEVRELLPVNNAVTATNLAAFESGALPEVNGVIGHQFAIKVQDSFQVTSGFRKFEVASFQERADQAGKSVLNLGSLLLHGAFEVHQRLHALAQGKVLSAPKIITLDAPKEVQIASGFSLRVIKTKAENGNRFNWAISLPDQKDDTLMLKSNQWTALDLGEYQGLKIRCRAKLLVQEGKPDRLFIRAAFVNRGYPEKELQQIEEEAGGSVGWPTIGFYLNRQIDEETVKEEIETELDYLLGIFESSLSKDYDLITMDYPAMDRFGHLFSLSTSSAHTEEAYAMLEQNLENIVRISKQQGYEVLIQSGHGFAETHTEINIHDALDSLTQVNTDGLLAVPGKVSAHIYLEQGFEAKDQSKLIDQIALWQDSASGEEMVEGVWASDELGTLGLSHPNAGDIYVLLKPGYLFSATNSNEGRVLKPALFQGDHGYAIKRPENRGVLIYPDLHVPDSIIRITNLAGFILDFIGVEDQ